VVLRGYWRKQPDELVHNKLLGGLLKRFKKTKAFSFWAGQQLTAKRLTFVKRYFRLPHVPHAWKVSTQKNYFGENPEVLTHNISYRLRAYDQLIGESLAAHLELLNNNAELDNTRVSVHLKPAQQFYWRVWLKLWWGERNTNAVFTCVQSIEKASPAKQRLIVDWLDKRIGSLEHLLRAQDGVE
jgi:hypothetical protein